MLKFYYAPNTVAVATAIALREAQLPHEAIKIDFSKGEQSSPDFLAVNPKGRVPAIVTERGVLSETGALLEYVAARAPEAGLMPRDPFEAARVRSLVHYLASTMHVNHAHNKRGHRWADDDAAKAAMTAKVPETMAASCAFIEGEIAGPLLFGEGLSIADCHLFAISCWLTGDGVDVGQFPRLARFVATMEARASVKAARDAGILS